MSFKTRSTACSAPDAGNGGVRRLVVLLTMILAAALMTAPTPRPTPPAPQDAERIVETIAPKPPAVSSAGPKQQTAQAPKEQPASPAPAEEEQAETEADSSGEVNMVSAAEAAFYRADIPLSANLQAVLVEACAEAGVDPLLMVGLIDTESGFVVDAVSSTGDYGLCQLNHHYFDPGMTPEENLRAGVALLGQHLQRYGNIAAALTAYHAGHDDGTRYYAGVVLSKAAAWGYQA